MDLGLDGESSSSLSEDSEDEFEGQDAEAVLAELEARRSTWGNRR